MSVTNQGAKTLNSAAAINIYERVILDSNGKWALAGAADKALGVALETVTAADKPLSAVLLNGAGTVKMKAGVAISVGALVYSAASGKIGVTGTNKLEGRAVDAASADGDIIEIMVMPVSIISL